jgi:hypothetical protein
MDLILIGLRRHSSTCLARCAHPWIPRAHPQVNPSFQGFESCKPTSEIDVDSLTDDEIYDDYIATVMEDLSAYYMADDYVETVTTGSETLYSWKNLTETENRDFNRWLLTYILNPGYTSQIGA